jgi:hypothetical protein
MTEEIERKARKGKFLVVGEDAFRMPPEEFKIAEVDSIEEAKAAAEEECGSMTPVTVYDDQGNEVYSCGSIE